MRALRQVMGPSETERPVTTSLRRSGAGVFVAGGQHLRRRAAFFTHTEASRSYARVLSSRTPMSGSSVGVRLRFPEDAGL
jgi:hypothetical protein